MAKKIDVRIFCFGLGRLKTLVLKTFCVRNGLFSQSRSHISCCYLQNKNTAGYMAIDFMWNRSNTSAGQKFGSVQPVIYFAIYFFAYLTYPLDIVYQSSDFGFSPM